MAFDLKLKLCTKLYGGGNIKNLSQFIGVSYRRSQKFFTEHLKNLGITSGQFMYIAAICEKPGETQDMLSQTLMIDKGTVANVLS